MVAPGVVVAAPVAAVVAGVVMVEVDETDVELAIPVDVVAAPPPEQAASRKKATQRRIPPPYFRARPKPGLLESSAMERSMTEALYVADGNGFVPTELTRGGWTDDTQHGGPPAGLLGRVVELVPTAVPMQVVRFTIDLFRPIPLRPLTVSTDVRRDGRRIQVVDASLFDGNLELGRATALKIRTTELDLAVADHPWMEPAAPETMDVLEWGGYGDRAMARFHYDAVEIRSVDESFIANRPGLSWFRLKYPLVAGEEVTPFARLATLSDMANGNARAIDPARWLFVNPDITIYCHRLLVGEHVGMHSAAHQQPTGIGVTDTWLFDQVGALGRINQAQLIEPRRS